MTTSNTTGWTLHVDGDKPVDYGVPRGKRWARLINDALWHCKVHGRAVTIRRPSGALYASDLAGVLVRYDGTVITRA